MCTSKRMSWAVINRPCNLPCGIVQNKSLCTLKWRGLIYWKFAKQNWKVNGATSYRSTGGKCSVIQSSELLITGPYCAGLNINDQLTTEHCQSIIQVKMIGVCSLHLTDRNHILSWLFTERNGVGWTTACEGKPHVSPALIHLCCIKRHAFQLMSKIWFM